MKKMFEDLMEMVWMPSWQWLKKHWKGYLVICGIFGLLSAAGYILEFREVFKTEIRKLQTRFMKKIRKEGS